MAISMSGRIWIAKFYGIFLNGLSSITIISGPGYTVGNKLNKLLQHLLICCLLPTAYSLLLYAYPPGWSDDILLTPEDTKSRIKPDIDVDEYNNVWAVWDTATWVSGTAEVLYSKRDSLGACLIPETVVSNNPSFSTNIKVAVDGSNNVQFIWRDETPKGIGVWHAKLANDGSVIVPSHVAVIGAGGAGTNRPEMVLNKYNEINIIWDESPSGYHQMNYTKLDTFGNPIIERIRVSIENVNALWPGIGIDSFANNHMAYRTDDTVSAYRLTYTKLDKDGNILIDNKFFGTGLLPTIIADHSQNIHMVYEDPAGPGMSIEYLKLDQDGNILIGPKTLNIHENNAGPHMAMDSLQYLHVVWHLEDPMGIMYTKIDTLGDFVISPIMVVCPPEAVWPARPRIAVDYSNRLHLVWQDQRLNPGVTAHIFYKRGENEPGVEETARLKTVNLTRISVFPNPFSKLIKISFGKEQSAEGTELKIYDASGRLVRQFDYPTIRQSDHVIWTGTDDIGNPLPAGVYFIQLDTDKFKTTIKIVKLD
jgi:hypothetical protein